MNTLRAPDVSKGSAGILGWSASVRRGFRLRATRLVWALLLIALLIPLEDTRPGSTQAVYDYAQQLFNHGKLPECQQEATEAALRFQTIDPAWASKFQLLEAESMLFRGMYPNTLRLLATWQLDPNYPDGIVKKLVIEAVALIRQQQSSAANERLTQAETLCQGGDYVSCGDVLRARGILANTLGHDAEARRFYVRSFDFARAHHDRLLEASASLNLGYTAMRIGHYDEALDWLQSGYRAATELGAENMAQAALGNLGFAYYCLGDTEKALELVLEAEKRATMSGSLHSELKWTSVLGSIYAENGDVAGAAQSELKSLNLATQLDSKEDIMFALEDLAFYAAKSGKLDEASAYLDRVAPMMRAEGNHKRESFIPLVHGMLAVERRQNREAEALFRSLEMDPESDIFNRTTAEYRLAKLFETEGNPAAADHMYKSSLNSYESERAQVKSEESRLPFLNNATSIYGEYIQMLVTQGKSDEALAVADRSRARTLEQGLGIDPANASSRRAAFNPRQVAQKTGATLLFYWLGEEHSYLWAIAPEKTLLIPLPPGADIATRVERYRKAILDLQDPLQSGNQDAIELYKLLIAPASTVIRPNTPVMILADGILNHLNFETLLVPGPGPNRGQGTSSTASAHYWIEDATLLSAPSLATLAAAKPARKADRNLLLIGNPVSPSQDFPSLPLFGFEMTRIESHFSPRDQSVFAGRRANPEAYLASNPAQYSYIHFVSHAVASQTDPLDSAIILSPSTASGNSFKLYAREIMQHPIDARLVTISACNGSGTRSYAGEGLVGLSWAFLHAGAHSVIGALWEVSDDSTPRLMDTFYQGLQAGQTPAAALRQAKLNLLYSHAVSHIPYYWAPFQLYTRQ